MWNLSSHLTYCGNYIKDQRKIETVITVADEYWVFTPDTIVSTLHVLSNLILTATPLGGYYSQPDFTGEKTLHRDIRY